MSEKDPIKTLNKLFKLDFYKKKENWKLASQKRTRSKAKRDRRFVDSRSIYNLSVDSLNNRLGDDEGSSHDDVKPVSRKKDLSFDSSGHIPSKIPKYGSFMNASREEQDTDAPESPPNKTPETPKEAPEDESKVYEEDVPNLPITPEDTSGDKDARVNTVSQRLSKLRLCQESEMKSRKSFSETKDSDEWFANISNFDDEVERPNILEASQVSSNYRDFAMGDYTLGQFNLEYRLVDAEQWDMGASLRREWGWAYSRSRIYITCYLYNSVRQDMENARYQREEKDKYSSFVREVQEMPHSSAYDPNYDSDMDDLDSSDMATLTLRQLCAGIDKHSDVLHRLLQEAAIRNANKMRRSKDSCESQIPDRILAASFLPDQPTGALTGRGRGRRASTSY